MLLGNRLIMAGDHLQLPPLVRTIDIKGDESVTLFERMINKYKD